MASTETDGRIFWSGEHESAKFWASVLNDLKTRVDGLSRFREAINAMFPKAQIQRCIIHQIRSSTRYVNWKDLKVVMEDLKLVYRAVTEEEAFGTLLTSRKPGVPC